MITKTQYKADKTLRAAYYAQFGNKTMIADILKLWSIETLKTCLAEDEHLNNLPRLKGKSAMEHIDNITLAYKRHIAVMNLYTGGECTFSMSLGCTVVKSIMHLLAQGTLLNTIESLQEGAYSEGYQQQREIERKEQEAIENAQRKKHQVKLAEGRKLYNGTKPNTYSHSNKTLTRKARKILKDYLVTFKEIAERPGNNTTDWPKGSLHYSCCIGAGARPFLYSKGPACDYGVSQDDLFWALLSDVSYAYGDFEDFCSNLGYDNDSRKAYAIYEECLQTKQALEATFTKKQLETLQEFYEEF